VPIIASNAGGKISVAESIDFFHPGNEQKVTSFRFIHLCILGWRRRVFETKITELKKGRRKGQRVIRIPKDAWAEPDTQKHLDICAAGRGMEGVLLKIECVLCV